MFRLSSRWLLVLLVAAAAPYFVNLGVSSIWDANEAFYAQTPREMIEAGDYVTPSFNFQLRMNKPVMSYWNVAVSYRLFGISEWSERLPIAIGGLVVIGIAFALGRLLNGTMAGLLSALVLATSPRLLLLARRIIIDVHITMWMGLILLCFALSETRPHRRLYLCLMYVAAGLGVLTKGPVAVFLPALVFLVYLASQKRLGDLRTMMLPAGAAHQPRDRRAVVLPAVSRTRLGLHRVVHLWRKPREVCRGRRRAGPRRPVLPADHARRFISLVADDSLCVVVGGSRTRRQSDRSVARDMDCRHRGVLFLLRNEGRPLYPADCSRRKRR